MVNDVLIDVCVFNRYGGYMLTVKLSKNRYTQPEISV
jgi:hypothetical protein